MKIDVFNHIFPQAYFDKVMEVVGDEKDIGKRVRHIPMLVDLDKRFQVIDIFGKNYRHILSLAPVFAHNHI